MVVLGFIVLGLAVASVCVLIGANTGEVDVSALGGTTVGTVFEGNIRRPLQIRLPLAWRDDAEKIGSIRIIDSMGRPIPLKDLADISTEEGPSEVERENIERSTVRQDACSTPASTMTASAA